MATIEKLNSIAASKAAIKAAIQEKGVSCDDNLAGYANRIKAISTDITLVEINLELDLDENTATTQPIYGLDEHSDILLLMITVDYYPLSVFVPLLRANPDVAYTLTNGLHTAYSLLRFNSFDYLNKTIKFDILSEDNPIQ